MEIRRSDSQPSGKGPADWFTGAVRIDPLLTPVPPARVEGLAVTFESGARNGLAYAHARPDADRNVRRGLAQRAGGPVEEIRPSDVVWFPPDEKHWHGASPTTAMTHIAIQESLDGKTVEWMEHVTDKQYGAGG